MSNVFVDKEKIDILANAISIKSGELLTLTLDEMVSAVDGIEAGGGEPNLQSKTYTVDSAGTETVTADSGYDGLSEVEVSVPSVGGWEGAIFNQNNYATVSGSRKWKPSAGIEVFNGGFIDAGVHSETQEFSAVPSNTTITPTESSQTIGGANYMMEGAVTVNAIPSNYVGSGITQRSSSDLTASGATVTVPSGYYSAQASKAVASGSVTAPASISGSSASVSTSTNTLTLSKTVSVTPNVTTAGYVSSGTAGNSNVSLTASVTTQGAQTLHPSTTDQTITGSKYLTGTQTFKAVTTSNLTADNIKSGVTVKIGDSTDDDCVTSVTGTYSGGGGGGATIDVKTITPSSNVTSLSFDVSGKPIMFVVQMNKNNSYINGSSTRYITSAANDGETVYTTALYKSGSTGREYTYNTSSWSYSNGTLTVTSGGGTTAGYFTTSQYRLIYAY